MQWRRTSTRQRADVETWEERKSGVAHVDDVADCGRGQQLFKHVDNDGNELLNNPYTLITHEALIQWRKQ
jgi:hypothetical protein